MKKVVAILSAVFILAACNKNSIQPSNAEVTGQVMYGGDPAADGIGYYIQLDETHENISPQNLPADYKHKDVHAHVAIRYFDTGATLNTELVPGATGPRIVVVRSIRQL